MSGQPAINLSVYSPSEQHSHVLYETRPSTRPDHADAAHERACTVPCYCNGCGRERIPRTALWEPVLDEQEPAHNEIQER